MKKYLQTLCLLFAIFCAKAQDPSFSQFYAFKQYLNPAMSGSEPGLNLAAIYRNQWSAVYKSLSTYGFAADIRSDRLSSGFGVMAFQDRASNIYRTTQLGGTYSFILRLTKRWNLNMGLGAAYVNKQIDADELVFSDQIDPIGGITGGSAVTIIRDKVHYLDLSAGMLTQFSFPVGKKMAHNSIGFGVQHLTRPDESFQNLDARLPMRFTVHAGSMIPLDFSKKKGGTVFYFSPVFKFDYQAGTTLYTAGFYNIYRPVYIGAFFQDNIFAERGSTKAIILHGGVDIPLTEVSSMIVGYSYDMDITGVTARSKGVHEVSLRVNIEDMSIFENRSKRGKNVPCYDFGGNNSIRLF